MSKDTDLMKQFNSLKPVQNKPLEHKFKTLVDRPDTSQIKNFDRMVVELSKYMTSFEIDACIDFMDTISNSKWDVNPSVEDCKTQLSIMFGSERVKELIVKWSEENQKLCSVFGRLRYRNKKDSTDKTIYDGLDPWDNPEDWEKIYI